MSKPKDKAAAAPLECEPHEHPPAPARPLTISDDAFERAAGFFRAAGDLARLKLLARLSEREWCVSELAEVAGVGLSTVSQQLRLLRSERLVKRKRTGKHVFYTLADSHITTLVRSALEHAEHEDHVEPGDDD